MIPAKDAGILNTFKPLVDSIPLNGECQKYKLDKIATRPQINDVPKIKYLSFLAPVKIRKVNPKKYGKNRALAQNASIAKIKLGIELALSRLPAFTHFIK